MSDRLVRTLATVFFLLCLGVIPALGAESQVDAASLAREWREDHEQAIVDDYVKLLSIPNVASDAENIRRNAGHILALLKARRFDAQLLEVSGSPPAIFAERGSPTASTTLMIYVHYDGQPASSEGWTSPPWTPVMRDATVEQGGKVIDMKAPFNPESRLFARSASDDKAPIAALLAAIDALDANSIPLSVNLKLFLEGEEEAGSPNLARMLDAHRDLLGADLWLFCDGPVHQTGRSLLSYGVRGSYGLNMTVHGPARPLHSGHYGNWAPNPIMGLVSLIYSMRNESGEILMAGYSDQVRPPTLSELEAVAAAPDVDTQLMQELGLARTETEDRIELAILRPAMNLRGIRSGDVGDASRNSIQTSATASIDFRLVPDQTTEFVRIAVEKHIRNQGYFIVHDTPTREERAANARIVELDWDEAGYPSYRTPMDDPLAKQVAGILNELADGSLVQLPTMGGSLPLYVIDEVLGAPILILPIANHDNNQHGNNENIRLQNLWDAIEIYATVLTRL